jgi:hypothetical protein
MSGYPGIRASDEDRSRTAAALGEHYALSVAALVIWLPGGERRPVVLVDRGGDE